MPLACRTLITETMKGSDIRTRAIRVISFDGDDTLWDFQRSMRRALADVVTRLRQAHPNHAQSLTVDELVRIRDAVAASPEHAGLSLEEVRLRAFGVTLGSIGVPDANLSKALFDFYMQRRFRHLELYADVLPTIEALSDHYILGLVSNGNTHPGKCGLSGRFTFVMLGPEHGVLKPDPRIFEVAMRQAGCAPGEMLHVGDSLHSDVGGARAAGVPSVWLNRNGAPNDTGGYPDAEIASLVELPALLGAPPPKQP